MSSITVLSHENSESTSERSDSNFVCDEVKNSDREEENITLHPMLKREDEKIQKITNRTVRRKRLAHIKNNKNPKKWRTADSYLNTERRIALAAALQDKARSHKMVRFELLLGCDICFEI